MSLDRINRVFNRLQSSKADSNKKELDPAAKKTVQLEIILLNKDTKISGNENETLIKKDDLPAQGINERNFVQSLTHMIDVIKKTLTGRKQKNPELTDAKGFVDLPVEKKIPPELQKLQDHKKAYQELSNKLDITKLSTELTTLKAKLWIEEFRKAGENDLDTLNSEIKKTEQAIKKKANLDNEVQKIDIKIKLNELNKKEEKLLSDLQKNNDKLKPLEMKQLGDQIHSTNLEKLKYELVSNSKLFDIQKVNKEILKNNKITSEQSKEISQLRIEKKDLKAQLQEVQNSIEKLGGKPSSEKIDKWVLDLVPKKEPLNTQASEIERLNQIKARINNYEQDPDSITPEFQIVMQGLLIDKAKFEDTLNTTKDSIQKLDEAIELTESEDLPAGHLIQQREDLIRSFESDSAVLTDINSDIQEFRNEIEQLHLADVKEKTHFEKVHQASGGLFDSHPSRRLEEHLEEINTRITAYNKDPNAAFHGPQKSLQTLLTQKDKIEEEMFVAHDLQRDTTKYISDLVDINENIDNLKAEIKQLHMIDVKEKTRLEEAIQENRTQFAKINPPSQSSIEEIITRITYYNDPDIFSPELQKNIDKMLEDKSKFEISINKIKGAIGQLDEAIVLNELEGISDKKLIHNKNALQNNLNSNISALEKVNENIKTIKAKLESHLAGPELIPTPIYTRLTNLEDRVGLDTIPSDYKTEVSASIPENTPEYELGELNKVNTRLGEIHNSIHSLLSKEKTDFLDKASQVIEGDQKKIIELTTIYNESDPQDYSPNGNLAELNTKMENLTAIKEKLKSFSFDPHMQTSNLDAAIERRERVQNPSPKVQSELEVLKDLKERLKLIKTVNNVIDQRIDALDMALEKIHSTITGRS